MRYFRYLAPILFALAIAVPSTQAQLRGGVGGMSANAGNVHIHVVFSNDRNAGPNLLVRLMAGSSDAAVMTSYTNDIGEAAFISVTVGEYHVEVSGEGIQPARSATFEVDNRKVTQAQYVVVNKVEESGQSGPAPLSAKSPMVSAADLNVPTKARKEVDKANEEMAQHNLKKALEHLNKAVALAPQYATAYNNLGVLYAKMNDIPNEEEALKKAVALDAHFAPALVNYGKLCLSQKNPIQAEALLQQANSAEPGNADTLMLLAYAQYMNRHFEAAIGNAEQAHTSGTDHPSFVHYIAARSYQQENKQEKAVAEFQIFLKEEPKGPRADHVRDELAKIQGSGQQASVQ